MHVTTRGGGGGGKKFLVTAFSVIFAGNPQEGGGVGNFFPYTYIQNFHEMWMFLAKWFVYCIESKHDKWQTVHVDLLTPSLHQCEDYGPGSTCKVW